MVLMIIGGNDMMGRTFQAMVPMLKRVHDIQKLFVVYLIIN